MNGDQRFVYQFGEYRLDPARRLLTRVDGERIVLTAKAFDALVHLVEHAGEPVSHAALTEHSRAIRRSARSASCLTDPTPHDLPPLLLSRGSRRLDFIGEDQCC